MSIGISIAVSGGAKLAKALKAQIVKFGGNPVAQVGVGTDYAVPVHERTIAFLRIALNEIRAGYVNELSKRVRALAGTSHPLHVALYEMALRLDAIMVPLIPVKTGRLRSTHFAAPPSGVTPRGTPTRPKSTAEGRTGR